MTRAASAGTVSELPTLVTWRSPALCVGSVRRRGLRLMPVVGSGGMASVLPRCAPTTLSQIGHPSPARASTDGPASLAETCTAPQRLHGAVIEEDLRDHDRRGDSHGQSKGVERGDEAGSRSDEEHAIVGEKCSLDRVCDVERPRGERLAVSI